MENRLGPAEPELKTTSVPRSRVGTLYALPYPLPPCKICGGRGSGKHYGVYACHGCRSFFRRSLKKWDTFICILDGKCHIRVQDKVHCKACRYKKCVDVGMRGDDGWSYPDPSTFPMHTQVPPTQDVAIPLEPSFPTTLLYEIFQKAEINVQTKFAPHFPTTNLRPPSGLQENIDGMTMELHYLVEWAKQMEIFNELDTPSKVNLLKTHSMELMFLEVARRSMDAPDDYFVGANGIKVSNITVIPGEVKPRVFSEILDPCKRLGVTDTEFVCLKSLVMFNPCTIGLSEKDRQKLYVFQNQMQMLLENIAEKGTMFKLLTIVSSLCSIAEKKRSILKERKSLGLIKVNKLLQDLVLDDA